MKKSFLFVLFMLLFPLGIVADDFVRGDVDQDGNVTVGDVTCLIDYLLNKQWPEDKPKPEDTSYTVYNVPFTMVYVEGGMFTMGATAEQGSSAKSNEKPAHQVTLSSYFIGQTEVTQELWLAVMGTNPASYNGTNMPVEHVSWNDCQEFVAKLNELTGMNFRLPTEAEWEYAARGGNKSEGYKYSGSNNASSVAWGNGNGSVITHPVATKNANELGIYDMSGNVWEWCQDWYGSYSTAQTNPTGPDSGTYRVIRGGGSYNYYVYSRVSCRHYCVPSDNHTYDNSSMLCSNF